METINSKYAAELKQVIADKRKRILQYTLGDKHLISMFNSDFDNLLKIAELIEKNAPKQEIRLAIWNLDTIVREHIPENIYRHFLYENRRT